MKLKILNKLPFVFALLSLTAFGQTTNNLTSTSTAERQLLVKNFAPGANITEADVAKIKNFCQAKYSLGLGPCIMKMLSENKTGKALFSKVKDDACYCSQDCPGQGTFVSGGCGCPIQCP